MSERPIRLPVPFIAYTRTLSGTEIAPDDLQGGRIRLEVPHMRHADLWIAERRRSAEALQPFEPSWAEDSTTKAGFRRRLSQYREDRRQGHGAPFFIIRTSDDALIGGCNLNAIQRGVRQAASLGYWSGLGYRRQGYVAEAIRLCLSYAFGELGLHRIEAACLPQNEASMALLRSTGFTHEGLARQFLKINGRWQDHEVFAILADEFAP